VKMPSRSLGWLTATITVAVDDGYGWQSGLVARHIAAIVERFRISNVTAAKWLNALIPSAFLDWQYPEPQPDARAISICR
jgi:hypothetical protein